MHIFSMWVSYENEEIVILRSQRSLLMLIVTEGMRSGWNATRKVRKMSDKGWIENMMQVMRGLHLDDSSRERYSEVPWEPPKRQPCLLPWVLSSRDCRALHTSCIGRQNPTVFGGTSLVWSDYIYGNRMGCLLTSFTGIPVALVQCGIFALPTAG